MTRIVEPLLGTRAELFVRSASSGIQLGVEEAVLAEVRRLEAIFTLFDERSELHTMRRTGSSASPELNTVLDLSLQWHQRSGGTFHPSTQALFDLWAHAEVSNMAPSATDLKACAKQLAALSVHTLDFKDLNLNGLAKGWICDKGLAVACGLNSGVAEAWLSIGGDLVHWGEGSLAVGIEDPHRPYDNVAPMALVDIANEALATSGGSRRYWSIGGSRYSQVLDPRTAYPVDHVASATVIAPDAATADVLATIAAVLLPVETMKLVSEWNAECFLVESNGSVSSSSNRFKEVS